MLVAPDNRIVQNEQNTSRSGLAIPYISICVIGLIILAVIFWKYQYDIEAQKVEFQSTASAEADVTSEAIIQRFKYLYNGLQTIARLESVRNIYDKPKGLNKSDEHSIQELYNLLYSFINLSEIYIVPEGFDPAKIDLATGKTQEPTITFDTHIIGKILEQKTTSEQIEEVEIYEYEEMKNHSNWFSSNFANTLELKGFNYPALLSKEVITCDNSRYSLSDTDNSHRSGLIYSVPFYNMQGILAGTVVGVILTDVLKELLPNNRYAFRNIFHNYNVTANDFIEKSSSTLESINKSSSDPNLIYSENIVLDLPDDMGAWNLWVGASNVEFWGSEKVKSIRLFSMFAAVATILLAISIASILKLQIRQKRLIQHQNLNLERRVQKRTAALEESQAQSKAILDNAADGIIILNKNGKIDVINKAAESIFGSNPDELLNQKISTLIPEITPEKLHNYVDQNIKGNEDRIKDLITREFTGIRRDNSEFPLELHISELTINGSSVYTGIFRDISARKHTERTINLAKEKAEQATRAKSEFLANMSHELRTPLNAIIGYCDLLHDQVPIDDYEQYLKDLGHIQSAGNTLLGHVNSILDLSKIEAGKMELHLESFDLNELIDEVLGSLNPIFIENKNNISKKLSKQSSKIDADKLKVQQIIVNLFSNSSKFSKDGDISITTSFESMQGIGWVNIKIKDTGIGMSKEQLRSVFNKFTQGDSSTTKKFGGTGLGLSISQHFCEMMGGSIGAKSELNKGSTITVKLPMSVIGPKVDPVEIRLENVSEEDRGRRSKVSRVLVIGDNNISKDLIERFLTREGFFADTVSNASQAVTMANKIKPDIIVIDENSLNFDSWSSINQLKTQENLSDIPIIMLTKSDSRQLAQAIGATDYLSKPIERTQLINIVTKHVRNFNTTNPVGTHALVIDDNPVNSLMLKRMIEAEGVNVETAENGLEGLERVEKNQPALIFLDIMMPVMDGFEFAERLRSQDKWRDIPIITVTGYDLSSEEKDRLSGYVDTILSKKDMESAVLLQEMRTALVGHLRK